MSAVGSMVGSSVGYADGTLVISMVGAKVGSLVTGIGADEGPARQSTVAQGATQGATMEWDRRGAVGPDWA